MIIENEENGGRNSDFWKEQFFGEFDYGKYFEDFLLIICSDKKLNNSTCGWSKNKICDALLNWNNHKAELKNVLEEYQIMSDFERKGECVKKDGWVDDGMN